MQSLVRVLLPCLAVSTIGLGAEAVYPAAKHGETYMHNYYLPPAPGTTPWWPSWAPDGKSIAIAMQGSIWRVDPKSGQAIELTYSRKYHSSPDWSPDGKWIVYTADDDAKDVQLEILNVTTGESHVLTDDHAVYADPVFSKDGKMLAYVSTQPNGYFNIYVRPIRDGQWAGDAIQLTQDNSYRRNRQYFGEWDMHTQPAWSPDGREILFVSNRNVPLGSGSVWRMPVEANGILKAKPVLQELTLYRTRPSVSPDGTRIIYASTGGSSDQFDNLYILPVAGGLPYKLTFGSYNHYHPRWSPDGEWIAYISNELGLPQLFLLETFGGEKKAVTITERKWKRPMGKLRVRVLDERTGSRTPARIYAPASDGKFYAPFDAYARIAFPRMVYRANEHAFYTTGAFTIEAPPGKMSLEAVKGFEYLPARQQVRITANHITEATLVLKPIADMAAAGWFNGTTHTHLNKGGNVRNSVDALISGARSEGMQVATILIGNKDTRILDWELFTPGGAAHPASRKMPPTMVLVAQEFRPSLWGHTSYVGLKNHLISPLANGYEGTAIESPYPTNTDMFRKAKAQGAVVAYAHAFGGNSDPERGNLGGAKGFAVDAALGTVDMLEWGSSSRGTLQVWHHALNNDLRITPVGGEDAKFDFQRHTLTGSMRTYAYVGRELTAKGWIEALRAGRTFFSNGPLVQFTINGNLPGSSLQLPQAGGTVAIHVDIRSAAPLTRAVIWRNGKVWKEIALSADQRSGIFNEKATFTDSGWLAVVVEGSSVAGADGTFLQAGTNAIRIYVGGQKIRNRESAEYFIRWIDKLQKMTASARGWRSQTEKDRVFAQLNEARHVYEQLAVEAAAGVSGSLRRP
jgi:TolB protein